MLRDCMLMSVTNKCSSVFNVLKAREKSWNRANSNNFALFKIFWPIGNRSSYVTEVRSVITFWAILNEELL